MNFPRPKRTLALPASLTSALLIAVACTATAPEPIDVPAPPPTVEGEPGTSSRTIILDNWTTQQGVWFATEDGIEEKSGANLDLRLTTTGADPPSLIAANLDWDQGLVGLVTRYVNEENWLMVWYDGTFLIAFQKQGGLIEELARADYTPADADFAFRLELADLGSIVTATADDEEIFRFDLGQPAGTDVGLFARNAGTARFTNVAIAPTAVRPLASGAETAAISVSEASPQSPGAAELGQADANQVTSFKSVARRKATPAGLTIRGRSSTKR